MELNALVIIYNILASKSYSKHNYVTQKTNAAFIFTIMKYCRENLEKIQYSEVPLLRPPSGSTKSGLDGELVSIARY